MTKLRTYFVHVPNIVRLGLFLRCQKTTSSMREYLFVALIIFSIGCSKDTPMNNVVSSDETWNSDQEDEELELNSKYQELLPLINKEIDEV